MSARVGSNAWYMFVFAITLASCLRDGGEHEGEEAEGRDGKEDVHVSQ